MKTGAVEAPVGISKPEDQSGRATTALDGVMALALAAPPSAPLIGAATGTPAAGTPAVGTAGSALPALGTGIG